MKPEPMQHASALPNTQSPLVKWLDQYGNGATIAACVAMIGGAIWYSYTRTSSSRSEAAWAQYSQARSAEDFGNIADVFSNTEVGTWARLSEGERLVDTGISLMFTNRAAGLGDLKKADEAFRKVLALKSATETARERAAWGLAKSTEAQSDNDTTKAIEGYTALLSQFPKSIYIAAAEERIESLKSPHAKEFYAWFHKQNPKPPDPKKPQDGLPDGHPSLDSLLDDKPEGEKSKTEGQTKTADPEGSVVAKLKSEIEIEFTKVPLQDALKFIAEKCDVEIAIDGEALKNSGFTQNMAQNLTLGKVTGLAAIESILKKYEKERGPQALVLVIQEDQKKALITTGEFAKKDELAPYEFSKPAELPKTDEPKVDAPKSDDKPAVEPKTDKPKTDEPKPESKDKDAPADSK